MILPDPCGGRSRLGCPICAGKGVSTTRIWAEPAGRGVAFGGEISGRGSGGEAKRGCLLGWGRVGCWDCREGEGHAYGFDRADEGGGTAHQL
jgi:hypothetical protein